MVLQRNERNKIFGTAPKGDRVHVTLRDTHGNLLDDNWSVSDENNRFEVGIMPLEASTGNKMAVRNEFTNQVITVENISIGEVWLAGGQSNMEFFNKYEKNWKNNKNLPINNKIHFYNVPQRAFEGHVTHNGEGRDGYGKWLCDKEIGYENFSAIGYIFARMIQEKLKVPVGIIGCNWGGTTASAWVPEAVLKKAPLDKYLKEYANEVEKYDEETLKELSLSAWETIDSPKSYRNFEKFLYGCDRATQLEFLKEQDVVVPMGPFNENRPGGLYQTMLKKVTSYTIKGALWYQGESDAGDRAFMYDELLKGLIASWRNAWNKDFPFLLVTLAPFKEWLACTNDNYKIVREKQRLVAETVENVYMTAIGDLGEEYDIHPKEKAQIGKRLAGLALAYVYHLKDAAEVNNPSLGSAKIKEGKIILEFDNAKELKSKGEYDLILLRAGDTEQTVDSYSLEGNKMIISLTDEFADKEEIFVSIGMDDWGIIYTTNENCLPIVPFETKVVQ